MKIPYCLKMILALEYGLLGAMIAGFAMTLATWSLKKDQTEPEILAILKECEGRTVSTVRTLQGGRNVVFEFSDGSSVELSNYKYPLQVSRKEIASAPAGPD